MIQLFSRFRDVVGYCLIAGVAVFNFACFGSSSSSSSTDSSSTDTTVTRGSTDVAALTVSSQVTLTEAKDSTVAGSRNSRFLKSFLSVLDDSAGTDYSLDVSNVYSYHNSQEALDMANEIMCSFNQTRYFDFVNQGPFIALIDFESCSKDQDHSSDDADQSSAQSTELESWVVDTIRTDDDGPQQVSVWIDASGTGEEDVFSTIEARVYIKESASEESPLGIFTINFLGLDDDGNTVMTGMLAVDENNDGETTIQMSFEEVNGMFSMAANAVVAPAADTGRAYTRQSFIFGDGFGADEATDGDEGDFGDEDFGDDDFFEEEFSESAQTQVDDISLVAYNSQNYLARQSFGLSEEAIDTCLSRDSFDEFAWGYTLYNEDGSRVERNSGISLKPVGSSDEGHNYCWAGYYGTWCPEEVSATEFEDEDGNNTYTLFNGEGRLVQDTRQFTTLGDLTGERFSYWDHNSGQNYFVEYSDGAIMKVATDDCDETGCQTTDITPEAVVLESNGWLGMWKDGFGHVDITADENGQLNDDMEVPYYINTFMSPDDFDGPIELRCYQGCLKGGLSVADLDANDPYLEDQWESGSEGYIYTFDPETYSMSYNGENITIADGAEISPASFSGWGITGGRMVTSDVNLENPWEVWSQDVTYVWEVGPNPWNKYQGVKNSDDEFLVFDRPLKCEYRHDDYGTFLLDYEGEGQLHGIPWTKIEEAQWEVWRPQFSLANASELNCEGALMYTKARDVEQTMQKVDDSECAGLTLPEDLGDPELTFEDPGIGDVPTEFNGAPLVVRVIAGALVE